MARHSSPNPRPGASSLLCAAIAVSFLLQGSRPIALPALNITLPTVLLHPDTVRDAPTPTVGRPTLIPSGATPTPSVSDPLLRARQQRLNGELANAVASYHQAIQTQPSSAVQSAIEGSAAMIDGGDYRGAIDLATFAIQRRSDAADAYLVRARANEALGDSNQALADLDTTLALNPADGYAGFLKGQIYQTEGDAQGAVDAYAQALARPMSRLWQVAAAARMGSILLDLGDPAGAVSSLQRAADIAAQVESNHEPIWFNGELVRMGSEARRPAVLLTLARAQDAAGAVSDAASVYAQIASDYPTSGESSSALSALEDDGFAGLVSDFVRGRVLLASGNPSDAIDAFASVAPDGPNAAPARYYAALAQGALGDATEEGAELRSMAREFPGHPLAATALQQAAQIVEATDSAQNAIAAYESVADAFPASDEATSSLFRAAALRLGSGDRVGAEAAWKRIADLTSSSTVRARALFARGRARLQDRDDGGATDLADAARAAPWSYDGLRAADVVKRGLGAEPLVAQRAARLSPPPPKSGDDSACASWLDSWASDAQEAAGQPAAIDRIRRLSAVGLSAAAESEALDAARDSASQPHALFALARALTDSGMFSPAIYAANRLASVSPAGSLESAPDCLRRIAYPQAFADLVQDQSMQNGLDPYVLLALLREESWFDPMARSGSPAYGLSQVTQPTGADIARGLGKADFRPTDLYRPTISVAFGAWYLGQQQRSFNDRPLLALAAYNAGPGNARRWTNGNAGIDPDDFVTNIDYPETRTYVRSIYEIYATYRALYGG